MTIVIPVEEAQSRFEELLERVERGEEVVLERDGTSIARIARTETNESGHEQIRLGWARGTVKLRPGWDEPMTDEELADWYGDETGSQAS